MGVDVCDGNEYGILFRSMDLIKCPFSLEEMGGDDGFEWGLKYGFSLDIEYEDEDEDEDEDEEEGFITNPERTVENLTNLVRKLNDLDIAFDTLGNTFDYYLLYYKGGETHKGSSKTIHSFHKMYGLEGTPATFVDYNKADENIKAACELLGIPYEQPLQYSWQYVC